MLGLIKKIYVFRYMGPRKIPLNAGTIVSNETTNSYIYNIINIINIYKLIKKARLGLAKQATKSSVVRYATKLVFSF